MEEDTMSSRLPKFLEPEAKLGMGRFADTLSQRSLSTSTPCVQRSASARTVEYDSGYAESLVDSICFSENATSSPNFTDSTFDLQGATASINCSDQVLDFKPCRRERASSVSKTIPKLNINFYSDSMKIPHDSEMDDESMTSPTDCSALHSNFDTDPKLPVCDHTNIDSPNVVDSNIAARLTEVLKHFSPKEQGRVIGRKMLLDHVDIIKELDSRNLSSTCISVILGHLEPEDLCRICEVTKAWRKVCLSDPVANARRLKYLRRLKTSAKGGKENSGSIKSQRSRGLTKTRSHPFHQMQLVAANQQEDVSPAQMVMPTWSRKWELYGKAAKTLRNDESLRSCRKCSHPSKVSPSQDRAKCQNPLCAFDFCVSCFSDFHGSSPCVPVASRKAKTEIVGSKKSKKNLRRLGR
ncbi:F-box only protein 43-like [Liolophura sinensis]|uniref:F-box only protein 43-like n=1 Tax=Liolophura sinensis TaxID=3198878 RepID=UPI0031592FA3